MVNNMADDSRNDHTRRGPYRDSGYRDKYRDQPGPGPDPYKDSSYDDRAYDQRSYDDTSYKTGAYDASRTGDAYRGSRYRDKDYDKDSYRGDGYDDGTYTGDPYDNRSYDRDPYDRDSYDGDGYDDSYPDDLHSEGSVVGEPFYDNGQLSSFEKLQIEAKIKEKKRLTIIVGAVVGVLVISLFVLVYFLGKSNRNNRQSEMIRRTIDLGRPSQDDRYREERRRRREEEEEETTDDQLEVVTRKKRQKGDETEETEEKEKESDTKEAKSTETTQETLDPSYSRYVDPGQMIGDPQSVPEMKTDSSGYIITHNTGYTVKVKNNGDINEIPWKSQENSGKQSDDPDDSKKPPAQKEGEVRFPKAPPTSVAFPLDNSGTQIFVDGKDLVYPFTGADGIQAQAVLTVPEGVRYALRSPSGRYITYVDKTNNLYTIDTQVGNNPTPVATKLDSIASNAIDDAGFDYVTEKILYHYAYDSLDPGTVVTQLATGVLQALRSRHGFDRLVLQEDAEKNKLVVMIQDGSTGNVVGTFEPQAKADYVHLMGISKYGTYAYWLDGDEIQVVLPHLNDAYRIRVPKGDKGSGINIVPSDDGNSVILWREGGDEILALDETGSFQYINVRVPLTEGAKFISPSYSKDNVFRPLYIINPDIDPDYAADLLWINDVFHRDKDFKFGDAKYPNENFTANTLAHAYPPAGVVRISQDLVSAQVSGNALFFEDVDAEGDSVLKVREASPSHTKEDREYNRLTTQAVAVNPKTWQVNYDGTICYYIAQGDLYQVVSSGDSVKPTKVMENVKDFVMDHTGNLLMVIDSEDNLKAFYAKGLYGNASDPAIFQINPEKTRVSRDILEKNLCRTSSEKSYINNTAFLWQTTDSKDEDGWKIFNSKDTEAFTKPETPAE